MSVLLLKNEHVLDTSSKHNAIDRAMEEACPACRRPSRRAPGPGSWPAQAGRAAPPRPAAPPAAEPSRARQTHGQDAETAVTVERRLRLDTCLIRPTDRLQAEASIDTGVVRWHCVHGGARHVCAGFCDAAVRTRAPRQAHHDCNVQCTDTGALALTLAMNAGVNNRPPCRRPRMRDPRRAVTTGSRRSLDRLNRRARSPIATLPASCGGKR